MVDYLLNGASSQLANGAQTLANPSLSPAAFAEYNMYNDSNVKSGTAPSTNPNGVSWIFFGNSIPYYNTGWKSTGNSYGSVSYTHLTLPTILLV